MLEFIQTVFALMPVVFLIMFLALIITVVVQKYMIKKLREANDKYSDQSFTDLLRLKFRAMRIEKLEKEISDLKSQIPKTSIILFVVSEPDPAIAPVILIAFIIGTILLVLFAVKKWNKAEDDKKKMIRTTRNQRTLIGRR